MREKISIFVITKNEEDKIQRCLEHLTWADEIVIIDSHSTDKTREYAKKFTKKIYKKKFEGYGPQKQAAIDRCTNQWILEIDADEIVTPQLKEEIKALCESPQKLNACVAYEITRQEYFLRKKLMTSKIVRFYKKEAVHYTKLIHEELKVSGKIGKLKNILEHEADTYDSIAKRIDKINEYTKTEATIKYKEQSWNIVKIIYKMVTMPIIYFMWLYLIKRLVWKGYRGLIWSILTGYYHFLIYAKIYEYIYKEKHGSHTQCQ